MEHTPTLCDTVNVYNVNNLNKLAYKLNKALPLLRFVKMLLYAYWGPK